MPASFFSPSIFVFYATLAAIGVAVYYALRFGIALIIRIARNVWRHQ